ncbi:LysR family transcriptional regulator [Weissella cibaria]|nr:LysR family transcriptional regulator [Weissella cibaria]
MELRVLRYFLAVARTGTLTAAAAQLNVTQPALSS